MENEAKQMCAFCDVEMVPHVRILADSAPSTSGWLCPNCSRWWVKGTDTPIIIDTTGYEKAVEALIAEEYDPVGGVTELAVFKKEVIKRVKNMQRDLDCAGTRIDDCNTRVDDVRDRSITNAERIENLAHPAATSVAAVYAKLHDTNARVTALEQRPDNDKIRDMVNGLTSSVLKALSALDTIQKDVQAVAQKQRMHDKLDEHWKWMADNALTDPGVPGDYVRKADVLGIIVRNRKECGPNWRSKAISDLGSLCNGPGEPVPKAKEEEKTEAKPSPAIAGIEALGKAFDVGIVILQNTGDTSSHANIIFRWGENNTSQNHLDMMDGVHESIVGPK